MTRFPHLALKLLAIVGLSLCSLGITFPSMPAMAGPDEPWQWPLNPVPRLSRGFDPPPAPWASGHRGVDLETAPVTNVLAPTDGRVLFVGTVVDRPVITVDHGNGVLSSFEPATAVVEVGDEIVAGDPLGVTASGGHCGSQCVHWGVRVHGEYVDPLDFIEDRRPSVLLPLPR